MLGVIPTGRAIEARTVRVIAWSGKIVVDVVVDGLIVPLPFLQLGKLLSCWCGVRSDELKSVVHCATIGAMRMNVPSRVNESRGIKEGGRGCPVGYGVDLKS